MNEAIELAIEHTAGIIDCRIEPDPEKPGIYSVTILYPSIQNGYARSEIYCYDMHYDAARNTYAFDRATHDIHPRIQELEAKLAEVLRQNH